MVFLSRQKKERQKLQLLYNLIDEANDGICLVDFPDGNFLEVNQKACSMLGYSKKELLSMKVPQISEVNTPEREKIRKKLKEKEAMIIEGLLKRKNGSTFPAEISTRYIVADNPYTGFIFRDITERKEAEERLKEINTYDVLTGLYNRRCLIERLQEEAKRAIRNGSKLSCFVIDIDNFKSINDAKGHLVGDSAIKQLAKFLKQSMRQTDIIGRYGGDEFIVLLPDTDKAGLRTVGDKLIKQVAKMVFDEVGKGVKRTVSLGAACFDGKSIKEKYITNEILTMLCDAVINDADTALYRAKEEGRNRIVVL